MSTMQDQSRNNVQKQYTCLCGERIDARDDLCEFCLEYCAKALDVDSYTYEDTTGEPRYFDILRFAHEHSDDLRMNKNNMYWTAMDF